jgi:hypothetical protein
MRRQGDYLQILLAVLAFLVIGSCGSKEPITATSPPAEPKCADRFRPLQQGPWAQSHLAFNTLTGRMCRTWDWLQPNAWGVTPQNLPVCSTQATNGTKECPDRFQLQTDGPWPESHLATDTKTGRLCRTWDWEQPNNFWRITRENTPTCDSLVE